MNDDKTQTINFRRLLLRLVLTAVCLLLPAIPLHAAVPQKNRLIVLTDIGADPDDTMSMVRLLLYSDQIDIEGLVATTSCWKRTSVSPELIRHVIEAHGNVQPNLNKNEPGFPSADVLLQKVKSGIPKYGMEGVGEGNDSEGSDWIIKVLEEKDARPLWVSVWGGANTLAQALYLESYRQRDASSHPIQESDRDPFT